MNKYSVVSVATSPLQHLFDSPLHALYKPIDCTLSNFFPTLMLKCYDAQQVRNLVLIAVEFFF